MTRKHPIFAFIKNPWILILTCVTFAVFSQLRTFARYDSILKKICKSIEIYIWRGCSLSNQIWLMHRQWISLGALNALCNLAAPTNTWNMNTCLGIRLASKGARRAHGRRKDWEAERITRNRNKQKEWSEFWYHQVTSSNYGYNPWRHSNGYIQKLVAWRVLWPFTFHLRGQNRNRPIRSDPKISPIPRPARLKRSVPRHWPLQQWDNSRRTVERRPPSQIWPLFSTGVLHRRIQRRRAPWNWKICLWGQYM